jgi:hypothetical protein
MVTLPLGTSTITLVVNDGQVDSAHDTVNVTVAVGVEGLQAPLEALVTAGSPVPLPSRAFRQGSTIPLKLRLSCGGSMLGDADVTAPAIVSLRRSGEALDLDVMDLDSGQANGDGVGFRFEAPDWVYNLSTKGLQAGTYEFTLRMPDGLTYQGGFVLR